MIIGIIKEGKMPADKRVPLTPQQCVEFQDKYNAKVIVQPSAIRAYADAEYANLGLTLSNNLEKCDVLLGVKEVPIQDLIPNKIYFFFSHTYKKQSYNRELIRAVLQKNIQLVDYEMLTNSKGVRVVAFGRFAGIVGAYNGLRGWGLKHRTYNLRPAHNCHNMAEMTKELELLKLPKDFKIVMTGKGRVAQGAMETLNAAGITKVSPQDFLDKKFKHPVYTDLEVCDYNKLKNEGKFTKQEFYKDPSGFESDFMKFATVANMYISCHFWDNRAPFIFSRGDAKKPNFKLEYVADISCDIDGPVASTLRPSTIEEPFYGYDAENEKEVPHQTENSIGVMAVDNLPCELPRDASLDFGRDLLDFVLPNFFNGDKDEVIWRASETKDGKLTPHFKYLQAYVNGAE